MSMFVATGGDRPLPARALQITPLERRALQLLAGGHTAGDVAEGLGLSAVDTEALLASLFSAMGATTRGQAVAAAHRRGLLD